MLTLSLNSCDLERYQWTFGFSRVDWLILEFVLVN